MLELEIINALCRGIDPRTGEVLDTPRDPKVDKLRLSLLDSLKRLDRAAKKGSTLKASSNQTANTTNDSEYPNRGKAWTEVDELRLRNSFAEGMTLEEMEPLFGRNSGALGARLVKLGVFHDSNEMAEENVRRGGKYGTLIIGNSSQTS